MEKPTNKKRVTTTLDLVVSDRTANFVTTLHFLDKAWDNFAEAMMELCENAKAESIIESEFTPLVLKARSVVIKYLFDSIDDHTWKKDMREI